VLDEDNKKVRCNRSCASFGAKSGLTSVTIGAFERDGGAGRAKVGAYEGIGKRAAVDIDVAAVPKYVCRTVVRFVVQENCTEKVQNTVVDANATPLVRAIGRDLAPNNVHF